MCIRDSIQSVFDFYDDWQQNILELVLQRSYQDLVDACFRVFHNPMIMFDADCKVLGMSSQYGENDVDREWAYLSRHGYSSIQALEYMKSYYPDPVSYTHLDVYKRQRYYNKNKKYRVSISGTQESGCNGIQTREKSGKTIKEKNI